MDRRGTSILPVGPAGVPPKAGRLQARPTAGTAARIRKGIEKTDVMTCRHRHLALVWGAEVLYPINSPVTQ
jgi:hypothetical protein